MKNLDVILIAVIVAVTLTVAVIIDRWVDNRAVEKQQTLERNFAAIFAPYPTNEDARLKLRPVVIRTLLAQRQKLSDVERDWRSANERILSAHETKDEASVLISAIGEVTLLENEQALLKKQFRDSCWTALNAGFKREADVSRCTYFEGSGGDFF